MTTRTPARSAAALRQKPAPRRTKTPVALGTLDARLGYFIRRIQVWIFQDFIRGLAGLDLSPAQFSVLAVIGANTGLSQAEISETLGIERARLARMLHELGRRGLTQRTQSARDARSHALQLTAEGAHSLAQAKTLTELHEARVIKRLGPEQYRALFAIARKF